MVAASISSRKILSILPIDRFASGRYEKMPAASCLMNPALSSSLWLATSTSEGASRNVRPNIVLIRMANRLQATGFRLQDCQEGVPVTPPTFVSHRMIKHTYSFPKWMASAR
jgi:hypothetical protein